MYLQELVLKNFRCFDGNENKIIFNPGLTVLVGENDSGKSAIMDAICIVLGTTDFSWQRIMVEDFYNENIELEINISCKFINLTEDELAAFLECVTYEKNGEEAVPCLYLNWKCRYLKAFSPPRSMITWSTGRYGNGPNLAADAKELLRVTYLVALRDAYSDMKAGKRSRLSQIVHNIPSLKDGEDIYIDGMDVKRLSLIGITNLSNKLLAEHSALESINNNMSDILNEKMLLKGDCIKTCLEVASSGNSEIQKITSLLEKLDLSIDKNTSTLNGKVGLGTSNILSMACELLLHKEAEKVKRSSFLLIEEPEAHIHAQRQLKLIQSLEKDAEDKQQQLIITTHSPLLASVVKLENIVIMKNGKAYPLAKGYTKLCHSDYKFLERYLDATKANLFFARSVVIVEGPGEALLLPTIAKLLGKSFTDFGTSLVDVKGTGLRRYAAIFQRENEEEILDVKIACITDRDIMPNCAPQICKKEEYTTDSSSWPQKSERKWRVESDFSKVELKEYTDAIKEKADGQKVKTFISNQWTLEYDLAYYGLRDQRMFEALINSLVAISYIENKRESHYKIIERKINEFKSIEEKAAYFYKFFMKSGISKAEFAQQLSFELEEKFSNNSENLRDLLPLYLVEAIEYVTGD